MPRSATRSRPSRPLGFALWVGFIALFFGGLAFALGPLLGRAGAAGVAGLLMVVLWVANGLGTLGPLAILSPFRWTADHVALVGQFDWAPLALVGVVAIVFLAIGVELFTRRDLGVTTGLSLAGTAGGDPRCPRADQPGVRRAAAACPGLGHRPWPHGSGAGIAGRVDGEPDRRRLEPDEDLRHPLPELRPLVGRWLPPAVRAAALIAAGFAGATFVSRWASDETDGRLEMVLATPLDRARWVIAGGIGAMLGIVVMTVLFAAGIGLGAASGGVAAGDSIVGSAALGLYAAAIAGVGVAVGGLWRTSIAAEIAALIVVATYLIDLIAPPLGLPDWVHQLALTAHLGQPMIGRWDAAGVIACVAIAVGGVLLGAWGMQRRDVAR